MGRLLKILVFSTFLVSILGYVDFVTGEISLDVLYLLTICLVSWYTNTISGLFIVFEIMIAKFSTDYFSQIKVGTHLYEWNSLNDLITYVIVCILVVKLKRSLTK